MSFFRKFASKSSKGVIGESSDNDLHTPRLAELRACEWPHNAFMEGAGILQEFTQCAANVGLTDFIVAECEQGGYRIMLQDIIAYWNNLAAAQEELRQWDPMVPAPQHFNIGPHGFYDW